MREKLFAPVNLPYTLTGVFLIVVVLFFWVQHESFYPDFIILFIMGGGFLSSRKWDTVRDWLPFFLILVVYEYLRGLIPLLNETVHLDNPIVWERAIFGIVPTVELQGLFFSGEVQLHDYYFTFIYFLHFFVPMWFAFVLWRRSVDEYRFFSVAFLLLSYAAFFTYLIFPSAPPWYAAQEGSLEGVTRIQGLIYGGATSVSLLSSIKGLNLFQYVKINDTAAIPSLHAAVPTLLFLTTSYFYKRKALLLLPYLFSVYIAVIYLGEHYAVDVLLGILYAFIVFGLVFYLFKSLEKKGVVHLFFENKKTSN